MCAFRGINWRLPALLKSSCEDTKKLLTHLRGFELCIPKTSMKQVQIRLKGWGIIFSYLEVHLPNGWLLINEAGQTRWSLSSSFLLPLFSWHIQATLSQLSQAVKEALWNTSHTHLAQINLCWTDFLMLIKSLETVKRNVGHCLSLPGREGHSCPLPRPGACPEPSLN